MAKARENIKSHCNVCLRATTHKVLHRDVRDETDEHDGHVYLVERITFELVECCGCESVSLRHTSEHSGSPDPEVTIYPPAVVRKRPGWMGSWGFIVPQKGPKFEIRNLFREVYSAIFTGCNRLALMGMRAIVDVALTDKVTDIGGFSQKLDRAIKDGWIAKKSADVLLAAINAGNAAAHRGYNPEQSELNDVLDIVEHLVQALYVLEGTAAKLAKKTPPRVPGQARP